MKNIKVSILGAFAFAMVLFAGCDDPCKDVSCLNGGTCLEGTCECPTGYEGTDCGTEANAKFTGTLNMLSSACDTVDNTSYSIKLTPSATDPVEFTIGGIYDNSLGNTIEAEVSTTNSNEFTIAEQSFEDDILGAGFTIQGSGSINGTEVTIRYSIFDVTNSAAWEACTDVFTN